jgi:hypothetical protein
MWHGNLKSGPQQTVTTSDNAIVIAPIQVALASAPRTHGHGGHFGQQRNY